MSPLSRLNIKAFTQDPTQGNPAAVFLHADALSEAEMIRLSREAGVSESAFVMASSRADLKVVFASPTQMVNMCGHGTIAAVHAWLSTHPQQKTPQPPRPKTLETWQGDVLRIMCHNTGLIEMEQKPTEWFPTEFDVAEVAALLGVLATSFRYDLPIRLVSTGTPKLLIPVQDAATLQAIRPDLEGIRWFCEGKGCYGLYPFYQNHAGGFDFEARQFNPRMGIAEDPVTGVAAAALGAYVRRYTLIERDSLVVRQGYHMHRGGEIHVTCTNPIRIGGYAVAL